MMELVLLVEGCGFPPLRQKQTARMRHGAFGVGWLKSIRMGHGILCVGWLESMENYHGL